MDRQTSTPRMSQKELLRKIQELAFMKVECELYLDAYPECQVALDKYKDIIRQYNELRAQYENEYTPIRQENTHGGEWKWVLTPWPWQENESAKER